LGNSIGGINKRLKKVIMNKKILIIIIFILAFLLRLKALNQSLWLDEGILAEAVINNNLINLITKHMVGEFHPPLYYILMWFWVRIFGNSEISLRMPSIIASLGLTYFFYLWLKTKTKSFSKQMLLLVLLLTSPLLFYYGQEARMYLLAAMLGFASMLAFYQVINGEKKWQKWHFVFTFAMFLTHYMVWFIWLVQLIYLLLFPKNIRQNLKWLFLPLLAILLNLPLLLSQIKTGLNISSNLPAWNQLSSVSFKNLVLIPVKFFSGHVSVDSLYIGSLVLLELGIFLYFVAGPVLLVGIKKMTAYQKLLWIWLIVPILAGVLLSVKIPMLSYFRFLYLVPVVYLLLAEYLELNKTKVYKSVIYLFIAINLFMLGNYLFNKSNHREDWKGVVAYIQLQNSQIPVVMIQVVAAPFNYYNKNIHLVDFNDISKIRYNSHIWLITYGQPIFDPNNLTEKILLDEYGFQVISERNFVGDIIVKYLYNPSGQFAYDYRN